MNLRTLFILILVVFNIGLDQYSKVLVREKVVPGSRTELVGKQLQLMNVENTGAFLSLGSDSNPTVKTHLFTHPPCHRFRRCIVLCANE